MREESGLTKSLNACCCWEKHAIAHVTPSSSHLLATIPTAARVCFINQKMGKINGRREGGRSNLISDLLMNHWLLVTLQIFWLKTNNDSLMTQHQLLTCYSATISSITFKTFEKHFVKYIKKQRCNGKSTVHESIWVLERSIITHFKYLLLPSSLYLWAGSFWSRPATLDLFTWKHLSSLCSRTLCLAVSY